MRKAELVTRDESLIPLEVYGPGGAFEVKYCQLPRVPQAVKLLKSRSNNNN